MTEGTKKSLFQRQTSSASEVFIPAREIPMVRSPSGQRTVAFNKGSHVTVLMSGGSAQHRTGKLMRYRSSYSLFFDTYCHLELRDGELAFRVHEDDEEAEIHSILSLIRLTFTGKRVFRLSLRVERNTPKEHVYEISLKAPTVREAREWVMSVKRELQNQMLVCKSMYAVLDSEGGGGRAEPLFVQMLTLVGVIYDGQNHFEVGKTLRLYSNWLALQEGRQEDCTEYRVKAGAMRRECEEVLYTTTSKRVLLPANVPHLRPPGVTPTHSSKLSSPMTTTAMATAEGHVDAPPDISMSFSPLVTTLNKYIMRDLSSSAPNTPILSPVGRKRPVES